MITFKPVSAIMTTDLITVSPEDSLLTVKKIFTEHSFHHLPVVRFRKIVGIISKSDFNRFADGVSHAVEDRLINESRLERVKAEDIMTKGLGKLDTADRINVALEIFSHNWFHALPVVENDELLGMVTTQDIIRAILEEKPADPTEVYD